MVRQDRVNSNSAQAISVLSELEDWEAFLKAEPEVIHKLREFKHAADSKPKNKQTRVAPTMRGLSL